MRFRRFAFLALATGTFCAAASLNPPSAPAGGGAAQPLRIGMIRTLFRDMDEAVALVRLQIIGGLIETQTGFGVSFEVVPDAAAMARRLRERQVDLGVMHGVEYGWARNVCSDVQPLVLVFNQTTDLKAHLVVHRDHPAQDVIQLQGQRLVLPQRSLNHTHLFLEHYLEAHKSTPKQFFGEIRRPANADLGLEEILDRKADVAAVDGVTLAVFQQRKPGRAVRLRVLKDSVSFPTATIAYHPGGIEEQRLGRIRSGLLTADRTVIGRQVLTLARLSGFVAVPPEYEQRVQAILKLFPQPRSEATSITSNDKAK